MAHAKLNKSTARPSGKRYVAVAATAALALLGASNAARADGRVHLWGIQRGCEQLDEINRLVERNLYSEKLDVGLLKSPKGQPLPPCQGERCGQVLERSCAQASGRVLGGQVVQGRDTLRIRLWLYDLASKQLAYQDDYCQSCDILSAVTAQSRRLMQEPRFGEPAGAKPSYCTPAGAAQTPPPSGPLFLTVFGDSKHKGAVLAALRSQLDALGRPVTPVAGEPKSYSREGLLSIVSGQHNARVLGADVGKDGKVSLFLFDQKTELTDAKTVTCPDCDRDGLVAQVKQSASDLLDRCIGTQCAGTGLAPPVEACEPFPDSACGVDFSSPASAGYSGPHIDARTAKLVKGLAWGAVLATGATAAILLGVSSTSAGTYAGPNGIPVSSNLDGPGFALLGTTALLLGVAIPTTLVVNRAARSGQKSSADESALILCPN